MRNFLQNNLSTFSKSVDKLRSYAFKCKYSYNKVYRVFIITIIGLILICIFIFFFACLYDSKIEDMDFSQILISSSSIYISGNDLYITGYSDLQHIVIFEQFVSLIVNNTFLATLTYNLFKTYNNVAQPTNPVERGCTDANPRLLLNDT